MMVLSLFFLSIGTCENFDFTGKTIDDFRLMNVNGKMLSLSDYPEAKGFIIIFTCNHCPFAKLYPQRMNELNGKYNKLGVPLIAISSFLALGERVFVVLIIILLEISFHK